MSTVQPKGDKTRRAVKWISEQLKEDESLKIGKLLDEAGFKFDLNPMETQQLFNFYKK